MKKYYRHEVLVAAHRGNSEYFPENTMPAFESALKMDIDMIETDIHMTKDGELIMIHDHSVDRCTDGKGMVMDLTLAEIRELDAGIWKGEEFKGTKVPTLREFLELVKDRKDIMLNMEFKDYPHLQGDRAYESCDKIIAMLEEYGVAERCFINSFSGQLLEYVDKKYDHKYPIHAFYPISRLGENLTRDPFEYSYCMCLSGDEEDPVASQKDFDYVISRGVEPWVHYGKDTVELYKRAVERGAVLFTANDPEKAIKILEELKLR